MISWPDLMLPPINLWNAPYMEIQMFDVIAVNLCSHRIRILSANKSLRSAEVIENMAMIRLGLDEEFFVLVLFGAYKEGDKWEVPKIDTHS